MSKSYFERTAKYFFARWQLVKHDDEFIDFCNENESAFEEDGMLNIDLCEGCLDDVEGIRNRFGLELIYHYSTQIQVDSIIDFLIFKNPFAVRLINNSDNMTTDGVEGGKDEDSPYDDTHPIEISPQTGRGNKIFVEVNIGGDIPLGQLKAEFLETIRHCRFVSGIENEVSSIPSETDFLIYDLMLEHERKGHKKYGRKIIEDVWPEDYASATEGDKADELYERLCDEYKNKGLADWDEKAFEQAYESALSMKTLSQRLADRISFVEKWLNKYSKLY